MSEVEEDKEWEKERALRGERGGRQAENRKRWWERKSEERKADSRNKTLKEGREAEK